MLKNYLGHVFCLLVGAVSFLLPQQPTYFQAQTFTPPPQPTITADYHYADHWYRIHTYQISKTTTTYAINLEPSQPKTPEKPQNTTSESELKSSQNTQTLIVTKKNKPKTLNLKSQTSNLKSLPLTPPTITKGIYASGYGFSHDGKRERLLSLIETTELNTIVIDIQDGFGKFMFPPTEEVLQAYPLSAMDFEYEELQQILSDLQDQNIYTIARVVTFQEPIAAQVFPELTLQNRVTDTHWTNHQGIHWLDMTNKKAWDIPIAKAREAIKIGFDEVQFDYIRFPTDGYISRIKYHDFPEGKKKHETMTEFFAYQYDQLKDYPHKKSADIFGFTYHAKNVDYDLNIGQRVKDAVGYFDYLSPMIYPSHYHANSHGVANPNDHPGLIVERALADGNQIIAQSDIENKAQSRAWIQDFQLGGRYTSDKVEAQMIPAETGDNNAGWLLWNPRNVYNEYALERKVVEDKVVRSDEDGEV